jgi:hypothetical protein
MYFLYTCSPDTLYICLIQVQLDVHLFFISFVVSSACFACYLHPSSGAQLQRPALSLCMVWCVITVEQVLVLDSFTLKHVQSEHHVVFLNVKPGGS